MTYDVVIAGAGPVGLFLACELRLAGASVLILEKNENRVTPLKSGSMGARGLNFSSVEALYRRGLLAEVKAASFGWFGSERSNKRLTGEGARPQATSAGAPSAQRRGGSGSDPAKSGEPPPAPRFAGHFAGIMLDPGKIDFSNQPWVIAGPSAGGGIVSLEAIERLLAEQATRHGADLQFGHEVTGFAETADGIAVQTTRGGFEARWLVGCDGGRSDVRKLAGFGFEGTDPELTGYVALVEFDDLDGLAPGFNLTPHGLYTHGPAPGRISVVDFDGGRFDRASEITLDTLQAMLRYVSAPT